MKYGELVILGYNGSRKPNFRRKKSKFVLVKKVISPGSNKPFDQTEDDDDLFQIGRSADPSINFVVTIPNKKRRKSYKTISRTACRIRVNRKNPNIVQLFGGGWTENRASVSSFVFGDDGYVIDSFSKNGVFVSFPQSGFGNDKYSAWKEVSMDGNIYKMKSSKNEARKTDIVKHMTNILKDGTLINLSGKVTLLWRSATELQKLSDRLNIEMLVKLLNARDRLDCLKSEVIIPRNLNNSSNLNTLYCFIECGHIQYTTVQQMDRKCTICQKPSKPMKLCMGMESSFYVDSDTPNFAFHPCGHMCTEATVKFWGNVPILKNNNDFISVCPFCYVPLEYPSYVKILF